jgi:ankyrin repeat protein
MAAYNGNEEMIQELLDAGARDNAKDRKTALAEAISRGHDAIAKIPLERTFPDVNAKTEWGYTVLHVVRSPEVCRLLLEHGVDTSIQTTGGDTTLLKAASRHNYEKVDLLLNWSTAEIDVQNAKGETPLLAAFESRNQDIVRRLLLAGAKVDLGKLKSVKFDEVKRPHPSKEEMLQIVREFAPGDTQS